VGFAPEGGCTIAAVTGAHPDLHAVEEHRGLVSHGAREAPLGARLVPPGEPGRLPAGHQQ
jgi:hypothetical protein